MRAVRPQEIEVAGNVVLEVDFAVIISNFVNLLIETNRRPTQFRPLDVKALAEWRATAVRLSDQPNVRDQLADQLINNAAAGGRVPSPTTLFLESYRHVAASLVSEPSRFPDAGHAFEEGIRASGAWAPIYVSSPALGYPRKYYQLNAAVPSGSAPFDLPDWGGPPGPGGTPQRGRVEEEVPATSSFRSAIANVCMLLDRPMMSDKLIPEAKTIVARDNRDPFFGQVKAALEQAERLTAIGLLYERQADAFMLRLQQSYWDMAMNIARGIYPREVKVLDQLNELRAGVLKYIPLHPFLESIANSIANVDVNTYYGTKRAALRHGSITTDRTGTGSIPAQSMMLYAMAEYNRMRAIVAGGENWPMTWAAEVGPSLPGESIDRLMRPGADASSLGSLAEWVSGYNRYVKLWPQISRELGWSGAIGAQTVAVEAAGADFILTDGDYYTDTPVGALTGLRPALSMGNVQVSGFSRRLLSTFGTGPNPEEDPAMDNGGVASPVAFKWSVIVARGYMSAQARQATFSRFYMPLGMLMGETNTEAKFAGDAEVDPIGQAVIAYYTARSRDGYVKQWYGTPLVTVSQSQPGVVYMRTDWDAFVVGEEPSAAQQRLLSAYGPLNVEKQPLTAYAFRAHFNMRVPVQMARRNQFEWYDELGVFRSYEPFDGHLLLDSGINLTAGTDAIDQYTNQMHVVPSAIDPIADKEVQPPEPARPV